ncbi:hypothetical protein PIB30_054924 [Stylosanthes scabra]|uniref:Uncharacterized protein n=1 Tax=Stylosanthes scabra TaxID=79078 RepID=A0ABU6WIX3_9FABA|nr:hypothetical protein [Stylosanthes scabra]
MSQQATTQPQVGLKFMPTPSITPQHGLGPQASNPIASGADPNSKKPIPARHGGTKRGNKPPNFNKKSHGAATGSVKPATKTAKTEPKQ